MTSLAVEIRRLTIQANLH